MEDILKLCKEYPIEEIEVCFVENGSNGKAYLMFFDGKDAEEKVLNVFSRMRVFKMIFSGKELRIGRC